MRGRGEGEGEMGREGEGRGRERRRGRGEEGKRGRGRGRNLSGVNTRGTSVRTLSWLSSWRKVWHTDCAIVLNCSLVMKFPV